MEWQAHLEKARFMHSDLLGRRHIADYAAERSGQVVAERCVHKARDLVSTIARVLEGAQQ
jgi:hypothetical protein